MSGHVGGIGEEKPADNEAQEIADKVKQAAEKEANRAFAQYEVVSYCTQLVAGLNYFIKVKVGDGENDYIHIRVYQTLSQETSLSGIQLDISRDAPIKYF